jgi:hypothetical protein
LSIINDLKLNCDLIFNANFYQCRHEPIVNIYISCNLVELTHLCEDLCSCECRRVKELYLDTGNAICIPDDSLPYDVAGFPNYRELGGAPNKELDDLVKKILEKHAESFLHSQLKLVLHKQVRYYHK